MQITQKHLDQLPSWQRAWLLSRNDPYMFATGVLGFLPAGADNPDDAPQLAEWQDEFLRNFFIDPQGLPTDSPRISVRSGHGTGKAQCTDEIVLTPSGWRKIGSIKVGDKVATIDGGFTEVIGVFPQGMRRVYRVVLDDGCSVLADGDHLWTTTTRSERKHGKAAKTRTTREIAASLTFPNGPRDGLNHRLPSLTRPIQHAYIDLPVDPYCLGVYLGNGHGCSTITTHQDDCGHYSEVLRTNIHASGFRIVKKQNGSVTGRGYLNAETRNALKALGLEDRLSWQKFVPVMYLHSGPGQRLALLQGLLDTDGTVSDTNNAVTFDTSSLDLADAVSELVRSLGGVARRGGRQGRLNGVDKRWSYRVYIALPDGVDPFLLPRKADLYRPKHGHGNRDRVTARFIAAVEEAGEMECVCIQVAHPSQLYVTRDHILTHNTTIIAILALWFPLTHYDSKTVVTANSQDQLRDNNWPEIRKWHARLPEPLRNQLEIREEIAFVKAKREAAFIVRRTASKNNPEALQGIHADSVLYLIDEASGIPDIVFEVAQGSLSTKGAIAVMFSNPTKSSGFFHQTHTRLRHRWKSVRVSSEDVPRARGHIQDVIDTYGKESNKYRVRVLGEFPTADDDTVIPLAWVEAAIDREVQKLTTFIPVWGVDVARFGDDSSALAKRQANCLLEPIKEWHNLDTMQLCGIIMDEYQRTHPDLQPKEIMVDVIGIGAGVVDRLRELELPVIGINVAESAPNGDRHHRYRDWLWWRAREWFQAKDCVIPRDEKLVEELVAPTYDHTSVGKIIVESKDEMKKRGFRSPNRADAFNLTFATTDRRIIKKPRDADRVRHHLAA